MPLPGGGKYRMKTTKRGKKMRLHFNKAGAVDEAKNMQTGATHTPREFAADRAKKKPSRFQQIDEGDGIV